MERTITILTILGIISAVSTALYVTNDLISINKAIKTATPLRMKQLKIKAILGIIVIISITIFTIISVFI